MITPFFICLREGIEIFLVIIPLIVYFNRKKLYGMSMSAVKGGALGAFLATVIGSIIFSQAALLEGPAGELFDGILGLVLSALILYSVVILRKTKSFSATPDEKYVNLSKKGVFILAAITFFRELLEVVLFILSDSTGAPFIVVIGCLLGLICAALIVYVVSKGITNLNIGVVFYLLNLFLVGLGAYFFGDGLEVLLESYIPQALTVGILVYAVPCYFLMLKKDLKNYLNKLK